MLTRRSFTLTATAFAGHAMACPAPAPDGTKHTVLMLNAACGDLNKVNVFEPAILHIRPGDEVTFLSTDAGHNTASKRGMLPDGAAPWNTPMDKDATLRFDILGVYGYVCLPHYEMGMVGLIAVGEELPNLKTAKKVRQAGEARKVFRALFRELEESMA